MTKMNDAGRAAVSAGVMQLFHEQAVTISKSGSHVVIQCENGDDANAVFDWLADMEENMMTSGGQDRDDRPTLVSMDINLVRRLRDICDSAAENSLDCMNELEDRYAEGKKKNRLKEMYKEEIKEAQDCSNKIRDILF